MFWQVGRRFWGSTWHPTLGWQGRTRRAGFPMASCDGFATGRGRAGPANPALDAISTLRTRPGFAKAVYAAIRKAKLPSAFAKASQLAIEGRSYGVPRYRGACVCAFFLPLPAMVNPRERCPFLRKRRVRRRGGGALRACHRLPLEREEPLRWNALARAMRHDAVCGVEARLRLLAACALALQCSRCL